MKDNEVDRVLARLSGLPPIHGEESYLDFVEGLGAQVLLWEDVGSYQGDSYVLLETAGGAIGYTTIGYGSCSGCDALQASHGNIKDMTELRDSILQGIRWFDNAAEALEYLNNHDWKGDWTGYYEHEQAAFVKKGQEILSKRVPNAA